jgi:hypothetical protein
MRMRDVRDVRGRDVEVVPRVLSLSTEENKQLVRRLVHEAVGRRNPDVLDEVAAGDFAQAAKRWVQPFQNAFPDFEMEIVDLIAEATRSSPTSAARAHIGTSGSACPPPGGGSSGSTRSTSSASSAASSSRASPRFPPFPLRTSTAPRDLSRSVSCSASASLIRRPARQSKTMSARTRWPRRGHQWCA